MRTMSREDWKHTHPDYKTTDEDGQCYVLRLEGGTGATVLEPVELEDSNPNTEGGGDQ